MTSVGWVFYAAGFGVTWLCGWLIKDETTAGLYAWLSVALYFGGLTALTSGGVDTGIPGGNRVIAEIIVQDEPVGSDRWQKATGYMASYRPVGRDSSDGIDHRVDTSLIDGPEITGWRDTYAKVQIYADPSLTISSGERLIVNGIFYPFTTEDGTYGRLMLRRGIAGRIFLYADGIVAAGATGRISIADRLHNAAVRKFASLPDNALHGVAAAMTTGDKRHISSGLRQSYTDGGGAHLLAVSGLHVGIVFLLVNLVLYFVPVVRRGHIVKNIVAAGFVWLFACAAGLSPSVVRAALMFSFAQAALARGTLRSALNILAASAFLMLALSPQLAADPGFILSYAAVLAIMLFFGPVFRMVRTGNRFFDGLLSVYIVGIAASLAVAPFVSYWFGRVPLAGIIVNPVVIITAHIIVTTGVLWLLWPFGFGGAVFSEILGAVEWCQNRAMEWCAGLGWGIIDVKLTLTTAMTAYGLLILSAVMLGRYTGARGKRLSLPE
ncbi:MAG: ComEC/Rec2 family competence protein [Rikenellaceae bacterium]|nr:ComEC/Rec2 family competence protein [Rikenellaceae bacterium]